MPSRPAAVAIVLFWLGILGYQGYARVLPWLLASDVPAVAVSATDEASRAKVRWTIHLRTDAKKGFQKAGSMTTEMKVDDADTYTFSAKYTDIKLEILTFVVNVPTATTEVTVDRAGHLRRQSMSGAMTFKGFGLEVSGSASVTSSVVAGELRGRVEGRIPDLSLILPPTDLPPVPVPAGQVLNPLLPVNRLSGVEPGRRPWRIRQVDPLGDSLRQLLLAFAKNNGLEKILPPGKTDADELLAEVQAEAETITTSVRRGEEAVACWVIAYRGRDDKVIARTWVSAADGRVMRQEATVDGNAIRLDRDE